MAWIHAVIDVPGDVHPVAASFWSRVTGWEVGEPWPGHPELCSLEPRDGSPYLHLQTIDGPPRVHVDVEATDPDGTVDRAVRNGARLVARHDRWQTLTSPGGLAFCVLPVGNRQAPGAVSWPQGHRSRMVQVCVDSPAAAHEDEVAFWRDLLAGRWVHSDAPEFAGKWHDDAGSPVQLLFQRLDEETGPVRAHLDHGTDDLPAEVERLVGLGATAVAPGRGGWHVLRDPAGMTFCATANSPEQVRRRDIG
jgi:hypothetical protein